MINKHTIQLTEFDTILRLAAEDAVSACAKQRMLESYPDSDYDEIERNLMLTREAELLESKYRIFPVMRFADVYPAVEKASRGSMLSMGDLLSVAALLRCARIAKAAILGTGEDIVLLKNAFESLDTHEHLEKAITDAIISEQEIDDNASAKLKDIRREIRNLTVRLKEKLNAYTRQNEWSKYLQDNIVTVRNGRYVLPVKAECRGAVKGLLHDTSASGSTVFIEPFAIVDLNNDLCAEISAENAEIERILYAFSADVSQAKIWIHACQETCIMSDIVLSKLHFSLRFDGICPIIAKESHLSIKDARHPLIDKKKVVPVTLDIGADKRILLISGPNTGGKTVSLKTAGLFCLMAYAGFYLPCSFAQVPVFDDIFCDIGDEQSIQNELSTFSSHMLNLKKITERMTERSLVLLDEPGGGTDPEEGAALAAGILHFIENSGATAIVTTHYGELKEYALLSGAVRNACMQFDSHTLSPTYRLIPDMPGTSNALKIAGQLGLDVRIIREAQSRLHTEKLQFDALLENAETIKNQALNELAALKKEREALDNLRKNVEAEREAVAERYERIKRNAAHEARRLAQNATAEADELIEQIKVLLSVADEAALLEAKRLRKRIDDLGYMPGEETPPQTYVPLLDNEIRIGTIAIVKSLHQTGLIKAVKPDKREAVVSVGSIKVSVRFDDLCKPRPSPTKPPDKRAKPVGVGGSPISRAVSNEIHVRGMTVSEAIEVIEPMLLSAAQSDTVRIVHGKGTGALGRGVQAYLKSCPLVESYRYGQYGEGDTGVTVVTLK